MKRLFTLFTIISFSACTPELTQLPLYTDIEVNYTQGESNNVDGAVSVLKSVISTKEFKEFALAANYNSNTNGFTNEEIYNLIREDWFINVRVIESSNLNRAMSYNRSSNVITYRSSISDDYRINTISAILMHEYLHQLGFHHSEDFAGSPSYYFQYNFEKFLNEYN